MNLWVNLTKRIQTDTGLRYCPVVESANGRIKPPAIMLNGKEQRNEDGAYYLEWRSGGQRKRLSVGNDPAQAQARRLPRLAELNAVANGITIGITPSPETAAGGVDANLRSIAVTVAAFLEETELSKKPKTLAA